MRFRRLGGKHRDRDERVQEGRGQGLTISREGLGERERAKDLFEGLSGGFRSHFDGGSTSSAI